MIGMTDKSLIDTTIIVYAYDSSEKEKREKCKSIVSKIFKGESQAYITNQILAELFFVLTKKIENPISKETAEIIIDSIINSPHWHILNYSSKTIPQAIQLTKKFNIPFWDSLITATMIENNVFSIITENASDFKKIPMLKVINPLN